MQFDAPITAALSKGRIFKEALPLLAAAGITPLEDPETSRKLILETSQPPVRLVIIRILCLVLGIIGGVAIKS